MYSILKYSYLKAPLLSVVLLVALSGNSFAQQQPLSDFRLQPSPAVQSLPPLTQVHSNQFNASPSQQNTVVQPVSYQQKQVSPKTLTGNVQVISTAEPGVVGLDLNLTAPYPLIAQVFQGTPAQLSGLLMGDFIMAVDGVSTWGKNRKEVDAMISDIPGQVVRFSIQRNGVTKQIPVRVQPLSAIHQGVQGLFKTP